MYHSNNTCRAQNVNIPLAGRDWAGRRTAARRTAGAGRGWDGGARLGDAGRGRGGKAASGCAQGGWMPLEEKAIMLPSRAPKTTAVLDASSEAETKRNLVLNRHGDQTSGWWLVEEHLGTITWMVYLSSPKPEYTTGGSGQGGARRGGGTERGRAGQDSYGSVRPGNNCLSCSPELQEISCFECLFRRTNNRNDM